MENDNSELRSKLQENETKFTKEKQEMTNKVTNERAMLKEREEAIKEL